MTKSTRKYRDQEGCYGLDDEEHYSYMLDSGYDWSKHSTRYILMLLRSQLGREHPEFNRVFKSVLSTRENILTKQQAKDKRKALAHEQKNR